MLASQLRDHALLAREQWQDKTFRAPVATFWVATFGASLHGPVNSFFYTAVGARARDIGSFGALLSMANVVASPAWGAWQDRERLRPLFASVVAPPIKSSQQVHFGNVADLVPLFV